MRPFIALLTAAVAFFATANPAAAQQRATPTTGGAQSLSGFGNQTRGGQAAGGNGQPGQIAADAGSAEGINRDFGDGLVGRGDSQGRFVGNQNAAAAGRAAGRADFSGLARPRATPPPPPSSPVRATLRVNFPRVNAGSFGPLRLDRSAAATRRALGDVSPALRYSVRGGVAVLEGRTRSLHDRRLAAALARLEPGVRSVDNQIVVPPAIPPLPTRPVFPR